MGNLPIFYVANVRMPTGKAHGIQVAKMCEAFASGGAAVTLVVPKRSESPGDIASAYGVAQNFRVVYLPVINLPLRWPGSFALETLSFAVMARLWLRRQKEKAILYTRGEMSLFLTPLLASRFSLVWEAHIKPPHPQRYHATAKRAVALVVVTKYFKEEIPNLWHIPKEKVLYVPDGVSLEDFSDMQPKEEARKILSLPLDKKIVLYAGSDVAWKGVDILRGASELLPEDVLVVFVGSIAPDAHASSRRLFVGPRPHTEMSLWFAAADALVLVGNPKSDIARYYTSPLKLFEYMASNRPILAADLPSFRDIVSQANAFIFEPSVEACAKMIRYALSNPDIAQARAKQAQEDIKEFSWHKRAQKILSFIGVRQ